MTTETLNAIILVMFLSLLALGATTTTVRGIKYLSAGEPQPPLLVRDIVLMVGLAAPLLVIFVVRSLSPEVELRDNLAWVLLTSFPALVSVAVYDYFELFVIGGPHSGRIGRSQKAQLQVIEEKIDENTEVSREAFSEANSVNKKIAELKEQFDKLIEEVLVANRRRDVITDARNATVDAAEAVREQRESAREEREALSAEPSGEPTG